MILIRHVRNKDGGMVPFSASPPSRWETGSPRLERYNGYSAVEIRRGRAGSQYRDGDDVMESLRISYRAVLARNGQPCLTRTAPARRGPRCTLFRY